MTEVIQTISIFSYTNRQILVIFLITKDCHWYIRIQHVLYLCLWYILFCFSFISASFTIDSLYFHLRGKLCGRCELHSYYSFATSPVTFICLFYQCLRLLLTFYCISKSIAFLCVLSCIKKVTPLYGAVVEQQYYNTVDIIT